MQRSVRTKRPKKVVKVRTEAGRVEVVDLSKYDGGHLRVLRATRLNAKGEVRR